MLPVFNANGVAASSPGLRGTRYPGNRSQNDNQPQRGCGLTERDFGLGTMVNHYADGGRVVWCGFEMPCGGGILPPSLESCYRRLDAGSWAGGQNAPATFCYGAAC